MSDLHDYLDAWSVGPSFVREVYAGEPPPAKPPNGHCVWQPLMMSSRAWVETDAHLRERITKGLPDSRKHGNDGV